MSSPGNQNEWNRRIRRIASVFATVQAPEVSQGRKCRASIAILYSSACIFCACVLGLATATLTEQISAPSSFMPSM